MQYRNMTKIHGVDTECRATIICNATVAAVCNTPEAIYYYYVINHNDVNTLIYGGKVYKQSVVHLAILQHLPNIGIGDQVMLMLYAHNDGKYGTIRVKRVLPNHPGLPPAPVIVDQDWLCAAIDESQEIQDAAKYEGLRYE